jgi:septal ring factor EnvC (AmiA/AmiB activator)
MSDKIQKPKKSMASKYPTRQALVYGGAAMLIVVVGLRTLLQVADEGEGFGLIEYVTLGSLGLEFALLMLYSFTIYQAGQENNRLDEEEANEVPKEIQFNAKDIEALTEQVAKMGEITNNIIHQMAESQKTIEKNSESIQQFSSDYVESQVDLKVKDSLRKMIDKIDK